MALGGGKFTTQNKTLPGTYINFVSAKRATASLSDRGVVALPLELDWGMDQAVFQVENGDFEKESLKIFGYSYEDVKLKNIRDLFKNAKTAYFYKLNMGIKASNSFGTAKCSGIRGNDLKTVILKNIEDITKFDVLTYLGGIKVDEQTVSQASELKENDFVVPKKEAELEATAGTAFENGTNGEAVTGTEYQAFLDKIESYSFHTLGCVATTEVLKNLFVAFTKRMRDEMGVKFQTVLYNCKADYPGVINIKNTVSDDGAGAASLVYWVTGASAACAVNKSNTNKLYDGEYTIQTEYKQSELETAVKSGEFTFHKVGTELRVLDDVNSFTSVTVDMNEDFQMNQVIRVLDQIGNDIGVMFNTKYLGKVQNNESGRVSFWGDIVAYSKELQGIQAIEGFESKEVVVEQGNDKKSVTVTNAVRPVCAMSKLYMTVMVS